MIKTEVEWHILERDPYDLPPARWHILTTIETVSGEKKIATDVYLTYTDDGYCWSMKTWNQVSGRYEEGMFWEEVTAWAYLPEPCYV